MQFLIFEGFVSSWRMAQRLAGSSIAQARSKNWPLESGSARKCSKIRPLENGSTRKMLEKFWLETRLGSKIFGSKCSSNENFGSVPSLFYDIYLFQQFEAILQTPNGLTIKAKALAFPSLALIESILVVEHVDGLLGCQAALIFTSSLEKNTKSKY